MRVKFRKTVATLLAVVMLMGVLPVNALAAEGTNEPFV